MIRGSRNRPIGSVVLRHAIAAANEFGEQAPDHNRDERRAANARPTEGRRRLFSGRLMGVPLRYIAFGNGGALVPDYATHPNGCQNASDPRIALQHFSDRILVGHCHHAERTTACHACRLAWRRATSNRRACASTIYRSCFGTFGSRAGCRVNRLQIASIVR